MARVQEAPAIDEDEMQIVYEWIDDIALSRPKRNITRDFADGLLMAEVVKHYFPRLVELHNYPQSHSVQQKVTNWNLLNTKVFKKMGFQLARSDIEKVANAENHAIERVLSIVHRHVMNFREAGLNPEPSPPRVNKFNRSPGKEKNLSPVKALKEKDQLVKELRETVEVMSTKINKLEQLVKLKDSKIQVLTNKLNAAGLN